MAVARGICLLLQDIICLSTLYLGLKLFLNGPGLSRKWRENILRKKSIPVQAILLAGREKILPQEYTTIPNHIQLNKVCDRMMDT